MNDMRGAMKYDENSIRILSTEELEKHSAHSILEILIYEYQNTSSDHLKRVAECLATLGYGVSEYREYRNGILDNVKLETIQEWFREHNAKHKN